ncbi:MAG TPA: LysR family transcriptional regulator [Acetobacteraceae bacterium]|nr:LysR family transcriptional regulator [Acetobacteraceae bacterium]
MELTQVRYFVALCRTLNFTRAAETCNVTQPALTRAIQRLEDELGGPLLYRERTLTQLTELGRAMRPHLEAMLEAAEAARQAARACVGLEAASVRIGLGPAIAAAHVAGAIRGLVRLYPELSIHFEEAGTAALAEAMLSDMLDCAVLPDDPGLPERLNRWKIAEEGCIVVLPGDHALAARTGLTADDLAGETVLLGERCGGFAHRLRAACGDRFAQRPCGGSWVQMLDLVRAGLGLALLPDGLAVGGGLAVRPLVEPCLRRSLMLTLVAGRPHSAAVANLVKLCRARGPGAAQPDGARTQRPA